MAEPLPQTLKLLGRGCAALLTSALTEAQDEARKQLEDLISRFKIWAGNIGLFASGRAGIDYRFESDVEARDVLYSMLKSLEKGLERLVHPKTSNLEGSQESRDLSHRIRTSEPESLLYSSSEESGLEEDSASGSVDGEDFTGFPAIKATEDVINQLYRFLKLVKSSGSSGEYSKVMSFASRHCGKEEDTACDSWIRFTIQREIPVTSATVVKRLVDTAMYRRWKMLYKQEHARKLCSNVEDLLPSEFKATDTGIDISGIGSPQPASSKLPAIVVDTSPLTQGKVRFAPMSHTEASTAQKLTVPLPARPTAPSNITPSGVVRRGRLDIPAPPKPDRETSREVVCPYCTQVIRSDLYGNSRTDKARWALVFHSYRYSESS